MIKFLLIFLGIVTSALAQIMLKKSSNFQFLKEYNFFVYFILGGLFYVFSFGIYAYVLKIFSLSKISPVMTIGTMLLVVVAGVLIFKEQLSLKQTLGILLGFVSIFLIIK
jgi:multidrug transporter EmrE-like cation transporter